MKRLTPEEKQEIIRLRVEENVPARVIAEKFCLSKSAVFNIVGEWKKQEKEPAPAATEASSEQEIVCDNIPVDIIPEKAENVKPDDILPCAVVDAVADQIDRFFDKLAECDRKMKEIQTARDNALSDLKELKAFLKKNGYGDVVKSLTSNAKWRALKDGE